MENTIIFVAGLGYSGSSAVIDLLKEVETYFVFENEFRILVDPDGIMNLRDALTTNWSIFQSDVALRRFRKLVLNVNYKFRSPYSFLDHSKYLDSKLIIETEKYIDELTEVNFRGFWYGIDNLFIRQLNKYNLFHKSFCVTKKMKVGKPLSEKEFDTITQKYLLTIINYLLLKFKKKRICFNENFSCMFPDRILSLLEESKLLLVIRDPRDVFASGIINNAGFTPSKVGDFLRWESAIYKRWLSLYDDLKKKNDMIKRVKVIKFEDLVLEYEKTKNGIFDFCNIDNKSHNNPRRFLLPEVSARNVGLWKKTISRDIAKKISQKFEKFYKEYNYKI